MLLYHFPLNTADNISNFTNVGLKNDWYYKDNYRQTTSANGKISNICCLPNESRVEIPINSDTFTLAFRVFLSTDTSVVGTWDTFISIVQGMKRLTAFLIYGKFTYYYWHGIANGYIYQLNKWCDVVLVADKGKFNVYYDGIKTGNTVTFSGNVDKITLYGRNDENSYNFNLPNQDIRIYDYALSQAEINEYSRALVVHYPLQCNELNGSVLKDVSGFGNDYTLQGTNSYQLDSAIGLKSLHTTDTAIYTQTPISSGYTTSFWCKYNGEWKHLCNNGSKYVDGVVETSLYDTIYATLTASGYDIVDYRVYATALSAEDIKNLYNSPISVSKQHQTMAFEFKENPLYQSKYWRTPTYAEMNYVLNTRTNAANLRTLGRVEISSGVYRNGLFLLPDGFVAPSGITVTITTAGFAPNTYSLNQLKQLESVGVVFIACNGFRNGTEAYDPDTVVRYYLGTNVSSTTAYQLAALPNSIECNIQGKAIGRAVRLIHNGTHFSTSATTKIDFAPANLQYHCTQHIWRFAEHSYDIIGADNANISDSYNGWIDLFGYGTSGVNYSPTLHTTTNSDYASGDISNTDNDWGINEIQSYDYNVKNFALNKNGIVQHNELRENDSDVNGCYQDKLITNELIEQ